MTIPAPHDTKHNHHTSTLSDASSTYSTAQIGQRGSGRQVSIDSKLHLQPRQSGGLDVLQDSEDSAVGREDEKRASGGSVQKEPSVAGSSLNTKDFGEFYDSYWRQSGQSQAQGNQKLKPTAAARDHRRAAQLESKPETIREVASPLASPSIGKAM